MKPTTTPAFVSPVRPHLCLSRLLHGAPGRAAGAQWPSFPTAQDGQSKSLPGSLGGNLKRFWDYRLFLVLLCSGLVSSPVYAENSLGQAAQAAIAVNQSRLPTPPTTPAVTQTPPATSPPVEKNLDNTDATANLLHTDGCKLSANNVAPTMVAIRPDHFQMGSPDNETDRSSGEGPQHQVTIPRPFAISQCEITVGQFAQFINATGYQTTAETDGKGCYVWNADRSAGRQHPENNWKNPGFSQSDDHPIVCVSWHDAQRYVQWLSERTGALYRLPTEAEWEYAARAGSHSARYFGDASQCDYANGLGQEAKGISAKDWVLTDCTDTHVYTAPVGSFKPNAFGLYDMLGNAYEWTLDCWHDNYGSAPGDGSAWLSDNGGDCKTRVLRGGSWYFIPQFLRSAYRLRDGSDAANYDSGFRVARAL